MSRILIRYGYTVWFDLALVRGKDYEAQIERELTAAKAVIVLWCGLSVGSEGVRSEASRAKSDGKLIPLVIEPCKLPLFSTLEQNIDLAAAAGSPRDPALDPILDDLERLVGRPPQADLKALREYEATWRSMGALSLARFPLEQGIAAEAVIGSGAGGMTAPSTPSAASPAHDYAFWERQWDKQGTGTNLGALRDIANEAPPYFANQARARIAEIEAAQRREADEARKAEERRRAQAAAAARYQAEGRIKVDARIVHGAPDGWFKPGAGKAEWFKDLDVGPEMVVVPAGSFTMGSNDYDDEKPPHKVTIKAPFAVGRFAVTFAEYDTAGLTHKPGDEGWGRGRRPVINVSWDDAQAYAKWLSGKTGKTYRLLSEAEWEYCCRAGTTTAFWWGDSISTQQANYDGNYTFGGGSKGEYRQQTVPVDSFEASPWGVFQVHGNVWEWCEDNWHPDYKGAPQDGSVWAGGDASVRVLRGGSWVNYPKYCRSAGRYRGQPSVRSDHLGFRLARTL